jgi:hypothetical protein
MRKLPNEVWVLLKVLVVSVWLLCFLLSEDAWLSHFLDARLNHILMISSVRAPLSLLYVLLRIGWHHAIVDYVHNKTDISILVHSTLF